MLTVWKRDHSMLTFETAAVQGVTGIIEKLTVYGLPLNKYKPSGC